MLVPYQKLKQQLAPHLGVSAADPRKRSSFEAFIRGTFVQHSCAWKKRNAGLHCNMYRVAAGGCRVRWGVRGAGDVEGPRRTVLEIGILVEGKKA